jgi:ribulose-phosphate 3-epimerase
MQAVICPTVTAFSAAEYREQLQRIQGFADRIHIDFMDGIFAPTVSVAISEAWWQPGPAVDLHVMYKRPLEYLEDLVALKPHMIIVHAESEGVLEFLHEIDELGIKKGLALLKDTQVKDVEPLVQVVDHVLIFSGELGKFGGTVDMTLLEKVRQLKQIKPSLEIGWDGGISAENAATLVAGGVDVLNVGGHIQQAQDPESAYDTLKQAVSEGTRG